MGTKVKILKEERTQAIDSSYLMPVEVAKILRVSLPTLRNAIHQNRIPYIKIGKQYRIPASFISTQRRLTTQEIKKVLKSHKEELKRKYGLKEMGVFGSYIRGGQKETSDVDILVEFEKPISLLHLVSVENHISDLLGIKVDLVPKEDVRPELKERILGEVVYL